MPVNSHSHIVISDIDSCIHSQYTTILILSAEFLNITKLSYQGEFSYLFSGFLELYQLYAHASYYVNENEKTRVTLNMEDIDNGMEKFLFVWNVIDQHVQGHAQVARYICN